MVPTRSEDLIDAVVADHLEIRCLFQELRRASDRPARAEAFDRLTRTLVAHETAEDQIVHPLTTITRGGRGIGHRRAHEEFRAERKLAGLRALDLDDPRFDRRAGSLERAVLRHAAHEEAQEHPFLRRSVAPARLLALAEAYREVKEAAPLAGVGYAA